MWLTVFYLLFLCFLLTYEPIWGYLSYQRFKKDLHEKPTNNMTRINYYKETIYGLWIPTITILIVVAISSISFKEIGFTWPAFHSDAFGKWVAYVVLGLFGCYFLTLIYHLIAIKMSTKYREKVLKQLDAVPYQEILPQSNEEKKLWGFVSLTAGVTEEIIYRGFLLYILIYLLPDASNWGYVIISGILFGLAHTYQGIVGVIRTSIIGILFGMIYLTLGSLIPLMILHFIIDYVAKASEPKSNLA